MVFSYSRLRTVWGGGNAGEQDCARKMFFLAHIVSFLPPPSKSYLAFIERKIERDIISGIVS